MAVDRGADALGLVSHMPSGPGVIADETIADIAAYVARHLPQHIRTYLLTARQTAVGIAAQHAACNTTTLQLVDEVAPEELVALRCLLPGVQPVQVIHVLDDDSVRAALAVAPLVDQLLLDSGNPNLPVKALGGTGRTHDWALSARIVTQAGVPALLAGGLTAANARAALGAVQPHGLDICSGVRSGAAGDSALDAQKLVAFMHVVKG